MVINNLHLNSKRMGSFFRRRGLHSCKSNPLIPDTTSFCSLKASEKSPPKRKRAPKKVGKNNKKPKKGDQLMMYKQD